MAAWVRPLVLIAVLTVLVSCVSFYGTGRFDNRYLSAEHQIAILERQLFVSPEGLYDVPEFRNRIMVPLLMQPLIRAGVPPMPAFVTVRLVSAVAMFAFLWWLVRIRWGRSEPLTAATLAVTAALLVLSFTGPTENPTDYPDLLATAAFCGFAVANQPWRVATVAALFALNRESAIFGGIIWMVTAPGPRSRNIAIGALVSTTAAIVALVVRSSFALPDARALNKVGLLELPELIRHALSDIPGPGEWYVRLAAGVALLWLWRQWADVRAHRGLLHASLLITAVTGVFGIWAEVRIFLVAALCFVLAHVAPPQKHSPNVDATADPAAR
ncbi:MAG TPA: hypothetical protein VMO26_20930 [Vicinamibacterales bacterium]|nr:hypothetical protein [Vicinamibacterales bacterium]